MHRRSAQYPLIDELRSALQHAMVLGLDTPGALDPLIALAEPLRATGLTALAERIEEIRRLHGADESSYFRIMNELVRLWVVSRQMLLRVQPVHCLSEGAPEALQPAGGGWLVLDPEPKSPWVALLEGSAPLIITAPRLRAEIERWQPSESLHPIVIGLSHGVLTRSAGKRLRELGDQALPVLLRLIRFRNQMVRIRAWEILLDLYEAGVVSSDRIRRHVSRSPLAMRLVRRLAHLNLLTMPFESHAGSPGPSSEGDQASAHRPGEDVLLPESTAVYKELTEILGSGLSRSRWQGIVRRHRLFLMLLPEDDPLIGRLIDEVEALDRSAGGRTNLLAGVPHPRITRLLLEQPVVDPESLAIHIEVTLDYSLIPWLLKYQPMRSMSTSWEYRIFFHGQLKNLMGLGSDVLSRVTGLGDSLLIPLIWRDMPDQLNRFGEVAHYLAEAWRNETDERKRVVAQSILEDKKK